MSGTDITLSLVQLDMYRAGDSRGMVFWLSGRGSGNFEPCLLKKPIGTASFGADLGRSLRLTCSTHDR